MMLKEKDIYLAKIQQHLMCTQSIMKQHANKKIRAIEFEVGSWVWLKLALSKYSMVDWRINEKLAPISSSEKDRAGCQLQLAERARIHPVFHFFWFKPVGGEVQTTLVLPAQGET